MADDEKRMSAFSALSFQEQQEKWRSWRSQHLIFEPAPDMEAPSAPHAPAPQAPYTYQKSGHQSLDRLYQRHTSALKKTGAFTSTV